MGLPRHSHIANSFEILSSLSTEELKSYKTEILKVCQDLLQRVEGHRSPVVLASQNLAFFSNTLPVSHKPSTRSSSAQISSQSHHPTTGVPPRRATASSTRNIIKSSESAVSPDVQGIIRGLIGNSEGVNQFVSATAPEDSKLVSVFQHQDVRVTDINIAGDSSSDELAPLRRMLSQRSLAIEFQEWELKNDYYSSVVKRAEFLDGHDSPGKLADYLRVEGKKLAPNNGQTLKKAIVYGSKLLVCESLFGEAGCSVLLMFQYSRFRAIKYKEFRELINTIKKQQNLNEIAYKGTNWLLKWQQVYDSQ